MPTVSVNLDVSQYVQVNTALNPIVLQSLRDTVRIALSNTKPAKSNKVYHELGGKDSPLYLTAPDVNIWVLAMTDRSQLIVSEMNLYIDQYSGAQGMIEQEHLQIHKGNGYTFAESIPITNVGGVHDVLISVPALTSPHLRLINITCDAGPALAELYKDTVTSADGTPKTVYNNNLNSVNTPGTAVFNTPTVTDVGTPVEPLLITGTKQTGSFGSDGLNEWILKASTKYLLRITNNTTGAGTSNFVVNLFWYEG